MTRLYTPLAAGLLFLFFTSCTTSPNTGLTTEPIDVAVTENVYNAKMIGTWRGLIPCADCPGIAYNLSLNEDNTFEETLIYEGQSIQPRTRTGTWQVNNGVVELDNLTKGRYRLAGDELQLLDNATDQPVETEVPTMYRLKRDATVPDVNLSQWNDSRKKGVDYVGNGNDPGWLVEVDLEKGLFFKTRPLENVVLNTTGPVDPVIAGNKTTYRAKTAAGEELVVVFTKEPCTDSMSGNKSDYTVMVTAQGTTYTGCGVFLNAATTN